MTSPSVGLPVEVSPLIKKKEKKKNNSNINFNEFGVMDVFIKSDQDKKENYIY